MPVKIVPPRRAWAVRQMARLWARREDLRRALNDSIALIDAQNLLLDGLKEENRETIRDEAGTQSWLICP